MGEGDKALHEAYDFLQNVKWHAFNSVWSWYYAEAELYVLKNKEDKTYQFVHASNPKKALASAMLRREGL